MDALSRFLTAQADPDAGFDAALREIQSGRKRGHWIWYVFPQLVGLGSSSTAQTYAIQDVDEATAYLRHPILRERLSAVVAAVAERLRDEPKPRLDQLMGSAIDARKLVSSLTLFREIARPLASSTSSGDDDGLVAHASAILDEADRQGIPPCAFTLRVLQAPGRDR